MTRPHNERAAQITMYATDKIHEAYWAGIAEERLREDDCDYLPHCKCDCHKTYTLEEVVERLRK